MKKIILCLSLFVLVSTCFVTTAMAAPKIMGIHGGLGVTATVEDAKGHDWRIGIRGPYMITGMLTEGTISSDSATIKTPMFPPGAAVGLGKVTIRVTIYRLILPDIVEVRNAFMLGPYVLLLKNIQN